MVEYNMGIKFNINMGVIIMKRSLKIILSIIVILLATLGAVFNKPIRNFIGTHKIVSKYDKVEDFSIRGEEGMQLVLSFNDDFGLLDHEDMAEYVEELYHEYNDLNDDIYRNFGNKKLLLMVQCADRIIEFDYYDFNEEDSKEIEKNPIDLDSIYYKKDLSNEEKIDMWVLTQYVVEGLLTSPKSADFPGINKVTIDTDGTQYILSSYVDSENPFGANIRAYFTAYIKRTGSESYNVIDVVFEE